MEANALLAFVHLFKRRAWDDMINIPLTSVIASVIPVHMRQKLGLNMEP
jgi:hypothetical protein